MLSQSDVRELVHDRLLPLFLTERGRLATIDLWLGSEQEGLTLPRGANKEQRDLRDLSRTPWLGLVAATTTQAQLVDGYRSPTQKTGENSTAWDIWERNDFDSRQVPIHHATNAYGYAYGKALPGQINGERRARLTGVDPSHMIAVYADEIEDEWPMYALQGRPQGGGWLLRLYDEEREHFVSVGAGTDGPEYIEWREHNVGVCPIVRYAPMMDLKGRAIGEVEPFITVAKRMNKNVHDRLLAQHYTSWKVRTATGIDLTKGLTEPTSESTPEQWSAYFAEVERRRLKLSQSDMLVAEDKDTTFSTLDETPLAGFVAVDENERETLAAVSQTPVTTFGKLSNVSADTVAEIRAGWTSKVEIRKRGLGKSHAQLLRIGAHIEGDDDGANDFRSRVTWQDQGVRSLAQAADAFGKMATMLGVPPRALWGRIPGVEKADVDEWVAMAEEGDALAGLSGLLDAQAQGL